jgi:peroxiredoxin
VLGVAFKAQEKALDFITRFQITFPIGTDDRESTCRYLQWPIEKPVNTPILALVDRKGTIREQHGGEEPFAGDEQAMKSAIESLLNENQSRPPREQ